MTIPFYDDLAALRDQMVPIIRGLDDLETFSMGPDARSAVDDALDNYKRRLGLIQSILRDIDALLVDGYPSPPDAPASLPILTELKQQISDIDLAIAAFEAIAKATTLSINLGSMVDKP